MLRRLNWRVTLSSSVLLLILFMAVAAPLIAPFDPNEQHILERYTAPNATYIMGTDNIGRDIFSRVIYGSQISLTIGLLSITVSMLVGVTIGMVSGYGGGLVDNVLMRFTDALLSFPIFFLLLTVTTALGRTVPVLILTLGLTSWGVTARLVRGQVLSLKQQDFVLVARSLGASPAHIIRKHLLPNILPIIIVDATLSVAVVILVEGGLSFLGVGVQPPLPSWGNMIAEGSGQLRRAWWISVFPGLLMFCCTLSFNILGDGLRQMLDPTMRR